VWPGNTVESWLGPLHYEKPVQAEYEWVRYTPLSELGPEKPEYLRIAKPSGAVPKLAGDTWLVENFEAVGAKNGGTWLTEMDSHGLGTTITPKPFTFTRGGAPESPGHAGRITGHLGPSQAPWPYAVLSLDLTPPAKPTDLRGFRAVEVWVKGDGRKFRLQLTQSGVTDWGHFHVTFTAPSGWTKLTFSLTQFAQPEWAKKVPATFDDVTHITFGALDGGNDFDLWIDDLRFLK
jgi:hypothetical protein